MACGLVWTAQPRRLAEVATDVLGHVLAQVLSPILVPVRRNPSLWSAEIQPDEVEAGTARGEQGDADCRTAVDFYLETEAWARGMLLSVCDPNANVRIKGGVCTSVSGSSSGAITRLAGPPNRDKPPTRRVVDAAAAARSVMPGVAYVDRETFDPDNVCVNCGRRVAVCIYVDVVARYTVRVPLIITALSQWVTHTLITLPLLLYIWRRTSDRRRHYPLKPPRRHWSTRTSTGTSTRTATPR